MKIELTTEHEGCVKAKRMHGLIVRQHEALLRQDHLAKSSKYKFDEKLKRDFAECLAGMNTHKDSLLALFIEKVARHS